MIFVGNTSGAYSDIGAASNHNSVNSSPEDGSKFRPPSLTGVTPNTSAGSGGSNNNNNSGSVRGRYPVGPGSDRAISPSNSTVSATNSRSLGHPAPLKLQNINILLEKLPPSKHWTTTNGLRSIGNECSTASSMGELSPPEAERRSAEGEEGSVTESARAASITKDFPLGNICDLPTKQQQQTIAADYSPNATEMPLLASRNDGPRLVNSLNNHNDHYSIGANVNGR